MKLTSYWLDTAEPAGDFRRNPIPPEVDVAVVGGGFTGLSAALELAKQGASVALLEQHTVGWGASGRNGGMATTGLAIGFAQAVRRYGERPATAMFLEYNRAIDTIESLVKEHGIECDFERTGKLTLAYKPAHFEGMKRGQALLAELADHHVQLGDRGVLVDPGAVLDRGGGQPVGKPGDVQPRAPGIHRGAVVEVGADLGADVGLRHELHVVVGELGEQRLAPLHALEVCGACRRAVFGARFCSAALHDPLRCCYDRRRTYVAAPPRPRTSPSR